MHIYVPYTYLIGWSQHKKYYYGVQYGKNANPKNLWSTYFTSSKTVKRFRMEHGDPDIIQVRHCFDSPLKSKQWEDKVLLRISLASRDKWLNVNFGSFPNIIMDEEIISKMSKPRLNTDKMKKPKSVEHRLNLSKERKNNRKWWNNGVINKYQLASPGQGFVEGMLPKDQTNHFSGGMLGKTHSNKTKEKMKRARESWWASKDHC